MVAGHVELVSPTLCFFHKKQRFETEEHYGLLYIADSIHPSYQMYLEDFFISSYCDVDKRLLVNQEIDEEEYFLLSLLRTQVICYYFLWVESH